MNIILEGPDGTGKSTLAAYLSGALKMEIVHSPGPQPRDEFRKRLMRDLDRYNTIFDRHPVVSERIYGDARGFHFVEEADEELFYSQDNILIFCTPIPGRRNTHVLKRHDTEDHVAMIKNKSDQIASKYLAWAMSRAHVIYRMSDNKEVLLQMIRGLL